MISESTAETPAGSYPRGDHAHLLWSVGLSLLTGYLYADNYAGSVVALIPGLIAFQLFRTQAQRPMDWAGWTLRIILALAIASIVFEPGWLNLALAWVLLAASRYPASVANPMVLLANLLRRSVSRPRSPMKDARGFLAIVRSRPVCAPRWNTIALPVVATGILLALLASANPVIGSLTGRLSPMQVFDLLTSGLLITTVVAWLAIRPLMEPPHGLTSASTPNFDAEAPAWHFRFFAPASVLATLAAMNLLLALQNGLDLTYLWGGASLPQGMTVSGYAVRGAYQLIATALLAAAFVIIALWPGSRTERSPAIRRLVYLWIGQNVFLVFSSIERTLRYVAAFGMTEWRLAGLIWMGLVAAGLIFVSLRIMWERTNLWLVNINLLAVVLLLTGCAFVDFKAMVAGYNMNRALRGPAALAALDFPYLRSLGPSALPALRRLAVATERTPPESGTALETGMNMTAKQAIAWNEALYQRKQSLTRL